MAERSLPFAGRIKHFWKNWAVLTENKWVLQATQGLKIDFAKRPHQRCMPNSPVFSRKEQSLLEKEIQAMLDKKAISELKQPGTEDDFYSNLFLVPKKDGGQRLVINLKSLNEFVKTEHFKMEGIHLLKGILQPGDWMAKIDLKDAYFMIPMHERDKRFLRFQWKGRINLPIQLSSVRAVMCSMGLYQGPEANSRTAETAGCSDDNVYRRHSDRGGYKVSSAKSCERRVVPTREPGFCGQLPQISLGTETRNRILGFIVISMSQELRLPPEKMKKIRAEARRLLDSSTITALELSCLLGKMNAATRAILIAPLFYRHYKQT